MTRLQEQLHREQLRNQKLTDELTRSRQQMAQLQTEFAAQVQEQVERHTLQWQLFHSLSQQMGNTLDHEHLFESILDHLQLLLPCDVSAALLLEGNTCELFLNHSQPLSTELQAEVLQHLLTDLRTVRGVELSYQSLMLRHLNLTTVFEATTLTDMESLFSVPIFQPPQPPHQLDRQPVGVLLVGAATSNQFTDGHLSIVNSVANQAAASLHQLRSPQPSASNAESTPTAAPNDAPTTQELMVQESLDTLKSRVIRTISHEYRTPLTIISLAAESLAQNGPGLKPEQRQKCLTQIQQAAQHMTKLVNEVLWISQAEAQEIVPNLSSIPLKHFCCRIINDLERLQPQWCDRIQLKIPPLEHSVKSDPLLLRHIINHLLTNALKYSPLDQSVQLQLTVVETHLHILVRDRGMGIPNEERDRIYDCFHRAHNVGALPGTGLGLTIVKRCVELLEGAIALYTHLDQGTEFRVQLPLDAIALSP